MSVSLFVCFISVYCNIFMNIYGCTVDSNKMNSILSDLESVGYHIEIGTHLYLQNSTEFGANPNGIYGVYQFDFLDVSRSPMWFFPGESAIIFHGCSPPNSSYFSYRSYLASEKGKIIPPFPIEFASMGDSLNHLVINYTDNISPFDSLITVITTGDQMTFNDIYSSFEKVNLQNTLNLDIIPNISNKIEFGRNPHQSDVFTFLARIAIPFHINDYNEYVNKSWPIYFI
eukprot:UN07616